MARLRTLAPRIRTLDTRTVPLPPKRPDLVYQSPEFGAWRARVVARAGGQCQAVDGGRRCDKAKPHHRMYADHIVALRDGGDPFDVSNGQCLCHMHHERKKVEERVARMK